MRDFQWMFVDGKIYQNPIWRLPEQSRHNWSSLYNYQSTFASFFSRFQHSFHYTLLKNFPFTACDSGVFFCAYETLKTVFGHFSSFSVTLMPFAAQTSALLSGRALTPDHFVRSDFCFFVILSKHFTAFCFRHLMYRWSLGYFCNCHL